MMLEYHRPPFAQRDPSVCALYGCCRIAEFNLVLGLTGWAEETNLNIRICRVHQAQLEIGVPGDMEVDSYQGFSRG